VGWQDRDYAKLTGDELEAIYGGRGAAAPAHTPTHGRLSTRRIVWTLVAMAVTAVSTFGWHERGVVEGGPVGSDSPPVLYGSVVTSGPLAGNVCTEAEYVTVTRSWRCDVYQVNTAHVPVYPAAPYSGPCAHMKVEGRDWICLSAVPAAGATS
jgi:hypothetical protein